jgi:ParB family chromosome partitioning protein
MLYVTDPALLDRLVSEKLDKEAEAVLAEGWKWVETSPRLDYGALHGFQRVYAEPVSLNDEMHAELDRLGEEYDDLIEEHGEDPEGEVVQQLEALSERIDALSEGGAFVEGRRLGICRGYRDHRTWWRASGRAGARQARGCSDKAR